MMKKIKQNIIGAFVCMMMLTMVACEGNLEPEVYDKLSDENFPHTVEDAKALVNGIYWEFRGGVWNRYNVANDSRFVNGLFCTDEFSCYWGGYWGSAFNFFWQPDQFPFSDMYHSFVPAITKATAAIGQLEQVTELSESVREQYVAEIKAARAYWMYDLYNMYGPVPVILDPEIALNLDEYVPGARPTAAQMVEAIETDLKDAIELLPSSYPESDFGRLTKGAAYMALLKLYMHEKNWSEAKSAAEAIIALDKYELQTNYKQIWSINNERNKEIIFAIPCHATIEGVANNFRAHVLPADWTSPSGLPVTGWNGYKVPWEFYDTFDEDDKRRETLQRFYMGSNGQTIDARETSPLGAIPVKYGEDPAGTGQDQGTDYVIYRYADVLLALAEAINEINGPNQDAIDLINQVRDRAFVIPKPVSLNDFASKSELRDYILAERGWELCFEGTRREDLIRHGKFVEYANDPARMFNRNPGQNARDYHVLYPIPRKAINENPLIKQNEGY